MAADGSVRVGAGDRIARVAATGWVAETLLAGGLMLLGAVAHLWLGRRMAAPWIMTDELVYSELAKSFESGGHWLIRGQPTDVFTLYPILIAPAWFAKSIGTAYGIAKALNAVFMTLAALPVYLWARRLVPVAFALLATALTLLMPAFLYTGTLMTENAFFPAFLLAVFLLALTLERPTLMRQLLVLAAVALAAGIRTQGIVLGLVVPTAIVFKLFLDLRAEPAPWSWRASARRLRPHAPTFILLTLGLLAYVVRVALRGSSLFSGIGSYGAVAHANYSLADTGRWIVYHLGELAFSVGFVPAVALIVLLGLACRARASMTAAERAFLATTAAALIWIVPQVAAFASRFSFRVEERNTFYLAPLLFLALAVWLARGMPRPYGLTLIALVAPAALFSTLPLETFFNISLLSDTFGLIPLYRLSSLASGGTNDVRIAIAGGVLAGVVLFALLPRAIARLTVPGSVALFLLLSSYSVAGAVRDEGLAIRALSGPNPGWVDAAIGSEADTVFLYAGRAVSNPHLLWQTEFWNRSVKQVYTLDADEPGSLVTTAVRIGVDGRIVPTGGGRLASVHYVVADPAIGVDAEVVASSGTLSLYRLRDPLRVLSTSDGISPDGWAGELSDYSRYVTPGGGPGTLIVSVSRRIWHGPDVLGRVRVSIGQLVSGPGGQPTLGAVTTERFWMIHSRSERVFWLPTPKPPFRAEVHISPTFSPSQFGLADTRQLGAQVVFRFVPGA